MQMTVRSAIIGITLALHSNPSVAQSLPPLLLFDGDTGVIFAGCLNCNKYDDYSVCNKYGDYGSKYSDESIWNSYGDFGSRYSDISPWSRYGEGLRIVDQDGNYYGRFTLSRLDRSKIPLVTEIIEFYEQTEDLDQLRDALCE